MSGELSTLTVLPDGLGLYHDAPLCVGCGACCMHMTLPPFDDYDDDDVEFAGLPDALKRELKADWDRVHDLTSGAMSLAAEPCCWLDLATKRCRHYDYRPVVCSRFQPGCDVCLEDRAALGVLPDWR